MARSRSSLRVWLVGATAVLLLGFGVTSFILRVTTEAPIVGADWVQSSRGPLAVSVEPESAAARAGLQEGDLLLQADGRPVGSSLEAQEIAWDTSLDGRLDLQVQRGNDVLDLELEPFWEQHAEPYTYLAVVGLAFWVSGMFIALRWPMIRGGKVYTLLALALFAQLTLSHTGRADALDWTIYWTDIVAGALVPAFLLHFGMLMSFGPLRARPAAFAAVYGTSSLLLLAAVWLSPAALGGAHRFADPVAALELRDRVEPFLLAISMGLTLALLMRAYNRSSSVRRRSQRRWLLWGLAAGLGPFVLLYALPWALGAPELPKWAQFFSVVPLLFVPAAFTTALARYRLYDLDRFLVRGFAEVCSLFSAFAIYAAMVFLLRDALGGVVPLSRSGTRYVGLVAMVVAYPALRTWVRAAVDRAFYSKRYSYRATLLDWARELNTETDLHSLLNRLRRRIRETLGIAKVEILTADGSGGYVAVGGDEQTVELDPSLGERIERESYVVLEGDLPKMPGVRYLFPMKVKGRLRAVLAVAERTAPEEPLSTEDRALLATLAAHAATAIEAARLMLEVHHRVEEIERLHARNAKILESSAVGLLLLDTNGRIQAWNRALEGMYGLSREETIGGELAQVFPLHVVRRIEGEAGRSPATEEARIFRISMANRQGERLVVNLAISPVDGEADGARVVSFDDVSARVKLEEQMLRQERLASLGLLAAGVAHEINTPLTGISGYAQLMLEECAPDDPRRDLLQKIDLQTRRASDITGSLLNLARPEGASYEPLEINGTIREVLQLFNPQVRRSAVNLSADLRPDLPRLLGDKGKLQQVLLNLLINARDAVGNEGRITVTSGLEAGKVVVEVSDDGAGIAEEDLPSIFDPFFTTKGRGKGTGLGLSITYSIVQEHGGQISVRSQPETGTRFRVELPAVSHSQAMA